MPTQWLKEKKSKGREEGKEGSREKGRKERRKRGRPVEKESKSTRDHLFFSSLGQGQ